MEASCQALVFPLDIVKYGCLVCSSYAAEFKVLLCYRKRKLTLLTFIQNLNYGFQCYISETVSCSCLHQFQNLYFSKNGKKFFVLIFIPLPFNLTFPTHIIHLLSLLCCQVCDLQYSKRLSVCWFEMHFASWGESDFFLNLGMTALDPDMYLLSNVLLRIDMLWLCLCITWMLILIKSTTYCYPRYCKYLCTFIY